MMIAMRICLACTEPLSANAPDMDWTCARCGFVPPRKDGFLIFSPALAEACSGFDAKLFPQFAALEAEHFWFRARNRLIQWIFRTHFPDARNFLEIGCGTGYVLSGLRETFPELQLAGSEAFPQGLHHAAERLPDTELWQMDARHLPFRNEFDVIGAFDVIEHIEEDEAVLAELRRAVRQDGGGIMLTVPQHPSLWSDADDWAHHVRRYIAPELKSKVERAGFEIVRMTSFVSFLLPAMWLSRTLQRMNPKRNRGELHESPEFKLHPLVNRMFEKVMLLENVAIKSGASFPAGGSLLVAAKVRS